MVELPARRAAFWSVMVVSVVSLGCTRVLAEEFPKDTNAIKSLSPQQAERLVRQRERYALSLNGLATLDADTAKALAQHKGVLSLNGLTTVSDEAIRALAEHSGGLSLGVPGLSAKTATVLAEYKGLWLCVYLDGSTMLDGSAAKPLAAWVGTTLVLNVAAMDAAATAALASSRAWDGRLTQLSTLDAATAKVLAACEKWDPYLPGLTGFEAPDSVAAAQALATRKGPLSLPNLKKISPKTLTALLQKEDVQIPLIETLELIPEPDGSPTEDFVIPEGVQDRQKRQR
jgi:hypothetical protein